ncbi:MAG: aminotransferase class I/II-fold pyridoxal phosphate-dependent enzyme [Chitinophagaceae bacterium]|nr:aminotransferase class I/II-fold pyridoxal phosphate-dependent enzyme [Chitinophagaceae bacterium]
MIQEKQQDTAPLSPLAETLIGSEIVKLGGEIRERIKKGEKIYNFTIGDFDSSIFPIPQGLEDLIVESYRNKLTTYPPADGIPALRESVSRFIQKYEGLNYAPDEVLIAAGGRPLIYTAYRAIVGRGDKVIYPVPSWNNNHYVHFTEGEHIVIEAGVENNFMPTAENIKPHVKDAVLIAVCSPLNPTGTVFRKEELEKICDLILEENHRRGANEKKLYLLYDQMYWTLTYGDTVHYSPTGLRPEMKEYTIYIDGISKAFAATGVRVGWALGPKKVLNKMKAVNSHVGAWSPMAEQQAVSRYLKDHEGVEAYLEDFKSKISFRLRSIYDGLQSLKNEGFAVDACAPEASIYLTIRFDLKGKKTEDGKVLDAQSDVTAYLLNEAKLAVVPFYAFGASKDSPWYRLSVGTCKAEQIDEMLGKLKSALQKLS